MTSPIRAAVARRAGDPAALVSQYTADFAAVLPSHIKPATFVRLAQGILRRDEKLAQAAANDPGQFMSVLLDAARLGLEPGTEAYHLVPFKGRVQGIVGWQGEIELMYRAGAVSSVIVETVREDDVFVWTPGLVDRETPPRWDGPMSYPFHEVEWAGDRGPLRLVYAYAVMKGGATSKVVVLNAQDIERAKKTSQGADSPSSPWRQHEAAMWSKTAVHRLAKYVPTSAEYITAQVRAVRQAGTHPAAAEEYVDAELVGDGGQEQGGGQ
ncbi:recombinase RecT [Streptomyces yunnanensis]|uniref:Recombinase RecT n=1 Tax=Streptomyces yunnanensis TaxID=156453 RepID=A0ABY8ABD1_9ACTN|nr:recombinase RecT [Streptomyces yunnanensis]WEB41534.1 recombinase RecT [Streptomyces yunnanensis]